MSRYINILSKLVALVLMISLWSCNDDITASGNATIEEDDCIIFSIVTENEKISTRGDFNDGSHVNRIYYQIYKKSGPNAEDPYILDPFYHPEGEKKPKEYEYGSDKHNGKFTFKLLPNSEDDENTKYRIICWAHYTEPVKDEGEEIKYVSPFYDISDFPTVKVIYEGAYNNDELRDAFYACQDFTPAYRGKELTVTLYRPFAQINVGTSGWDYEGLASIEPNKKIVLFSEIKMKGVADKIDLLNNEAKESDTLKDKYVTFRYSKIPAYRNLPDKSLKNVTGIYVDDTTEREANPSKEITYHKGVYLEEETYEEFLQISFPEDERPGNPNGPSLWKSFDKNDDGFADYISWTEYDRKCVSSTGHDELLYNIYTETFKYLSMSYVLVPFSVKRDENGKEIRIGSSLNEVIFNCAEMDENDEIQDIYEDKNVIELRNVPVGSNIRTNIIAANGTGFFMNSNEINVAIQEETFADYYRRLGATDSDWNEKGPKNDPDRNGDNLNGDYEWGDDDIDPNEGKTPVVLPGLKDFKLKTNSGDVKDWGNVSGKYVDMIRYLDDEITIKFNLKEGLNRYSQLKDVLDVNKLTYKYSLCGEELPGNRVSKSGDECSITINMRELTPFIDNREVSPVTFSLTEYETLYNETDNLVTSKVEDRDFYLRYYPLEFRVSTDFGESNPKFRSEDLVVTMRVYTSYKFTFSSTSKDDGKNIFQGIIDKGLLGPNGDNSGSLLEDEKKSYFIYKDMKISSSYITVLPRPNNGNNDKIYAIKEADSDIEDHLRMRGAHINGSNKGHYIIFRNLKENCKITAKIGRDKGVDNSSKYNNGYNIYNRGFHINWGENGPISLDAYGAGSEDLAGNRWNGITPSGEQNKDPKLLQASKGEKTTYVHSESKITDSKDTGITYFGENGKDVTLYIDSAGHSYYWIIISEPED